MARYSREDIEALFRRLDGGANNIIADSPQLARSPRAASTIIRSSMVETNLEAAEVRDV